MTDVQKVKLLVFGNSADATFADPDVQVLLDLSGGSVFLASALVCDSRAATVGSSLKEVRIGDFSDTSGRNQVSALQAQGKAFRELEYNTPAFAVVEDNVSDFAALQIIRNYVLRTEAD